MWIANNWKDYEVLDTSAGEKLERWGNYILVRPDPQVLWDTPRDHKGWRQKNGHYHRSARGGGEWEFFDLPNEWSISYPLPWLLGSGSKTASKEHLTFHLKPFNFKHTGLFPEQAANWDWFSQLIQSAKRSRADGPIKVLNLFAYTGLELKVDKNGEGHCYTCMGCRSFLTPYVDPETGKPKYYGRFNQGVVTINLPDVALSSGGNIEKFWEIFEERLELCHQALLCRHERLKGTPSDVAPILWQYGACARLKKGEPIDKLLYGGYSTISLGYAGLYECVKYMTGKSHTDPSATPFALEIMETMNAACRKWKAEHNIDFSLYGTPLESTTYKFAKCLQRRFGIVEGINDKGYITNSYHVHVTEQINAFDKLKFEAQFQHLSPGGAISYVEVPDMQNNLEAVLQVMKFIYDNIIYAELNTKSDYCQVCGWDGEIRIEEEHGKLVWKCPKCGNTDQDKMNVARRTCGYIGTQYWNQGRTQEIRDRVLHL